MNQYGKILWQDLTVEHADQVRNFYEQVVGWTSSALSMGDYDDYLMLPATGEKPIAGICHQQGPNQHIPSQWLTYVTVQSLDHAIQNCLSLGGKVIDGPRPMGNGRFVVIQDPAGAYMALVEE